MARKKLLGRALALVMIFAVARAYALIDPNFTPVHLVEQSGLILELELKQGDAKDKYTAKVVNVLKGKTDLKAFTIDLSKAVNVQQADAFRNLAGGAAGTPALLFVGEFLADGPGPGGMPAEAPKKVGYLHVGGRWCDLDAADAGTWNLVMINGDRQKLWAGGTDMLLRAVRYILHDDDPQVPATAGVTWAGEPAKIATFAGKVNAVRPIDLAGDGRFALFVASDKGDHLLVCDPKSRKFKDVTAEKKLTSASAVFTWGDFNGDGALDLVSFDGKAFGLHAQQADGTFKPAVLELGPPELAKGCVGLGALDCGHAGFSGLLVSGSAAPTLVVFDADGKPTATLLNAKGIDVAAYGNPGACLVADFDGDSLPDIIQPFATRSLFFKGEAVGKFASAVPCPMHLGRGQSSACLADFDADGRLDIFTVAEDSCRIWQNEGGGKFADFLGVSGEIAYISRPGGVDCMAGDVNNDGRQDVLICYDTEPPHIFFNRGFRSFGHAHEVDLSEKDMLEAAKKGQRSGCLGDFDGDGAQDMVLALPNGEAYVCFRENADADACNLTAVLPVKGAYKGPLTVVGWIKGDEKRGKPDRCLGAWNVAPGSAAAFIGLKQPGPVTVKWTLPGGKQQEKQIDVENGTVRFQIK